MEWVFCNQCYHPRPQEDRMKVCTQCKNPIWFSSTSAIELLLNKIKYIEEELWKINP